MHSLVYQGGVEEEMEGCRGGNLLRGEDNFPPTKGITVVGGGGVGGGGEQRKFWLFPILNAYTSIKTETRKDHNLSAKSYLSILLGFPISNASYFTTNKNKPGVDALLKRLVQLSSFDGLSSLGWRFHSPYSIV